MKISSYKKGLWSEYFCILFLFIRGYRILNHRYKTKLGEIDIIAKKGNFVVFIEVKARDDAENGAYALQNNSIKRIIRTAELWRSEQAILNANYNMRFDLMVVTSFYKKPKWHQNIINT